jgi:2-polyprenyl-6-methoxyphenol hydroxylase-like FAD-dependent oxidoreductase
MRMPFDTDVVVIGAGPVGLTLANELTRHGAACRLVDKAPGIREVSKAMILHVRTQEVLAKVGAIERIRREAQPLTEVVVHAYGKHVGSWDLDRIDSPFPSPVILGQNRTQHALLDLLASRGVEPSWLTEAVSMEFDAEGVTTTLKRSDPADPAPGGEVIRSRFVVGCEGSNSLVRRTLGFTFEGERYTGEQFIQADCRIRWALPKGRSYLFLTKVGYLMVIEFPGDVVRIFISLPDDRAAGQGAQEAARQLGATESATEQPTLEEIAGHLTALTGFACELADPIWLARYRTSHRYANRFSQGRAFIAGDAAHVHVPIGGQGMNTGIQDAFNLGWKLAGVARGDLKPSVLDSYHAERHPVAEGLIKGTNFAYTGILHPSEAKQRAVRWFGPYLIRSSTVQNIMRSTLEELNIVYPDSPLNLDLGGATGPRPGERVLDADVVRASDLTTTSIEELTRTTSWTLMLFSGTARGLDASQLARLASGVRSSVDDRVAVSMVIASRSVPNDLHDGPVALLDPLHSAHDRYGISGPSFYLLRPDTYVAARGPLVSLDDLKRHLAGIFS